MNQKPSVYTDEHLAAMHDDEFAIAIDELDPSERIRLRVFRSAWRDPLGPEARMVGDFSVAARRIKAEKRLPADPDADKNLFDEIISQGEASGVLRTKRPGGAQ